MRYYAIFWGSYAILFGLQDLKKIQFWQQKKYISMIWSPIARIQTESNPGQQWWGACSIVHRYISTDGDGGGKPEASDSQQNLPRNGVKWLISMDRETNKQTHSVLSWYYSKHAAKNLHVGTIKQNKTPKAEQV